MARRKAWGGTGIAAAAAAAMMAQQVAAKSTRDTLFLSCFAVSRWPVMLAWASVVSIVVAFAATRAMTRLGPRRVMPAACAISAVLMLGIALVATRQRSLAAVLLFLHAAAIGPVLISGFWSLFNERFDPRTAKRAISQVGGLGTLGGLAGGIVANLVATRAGVAAMLPILGALHLLCAVALRSPARQSRAPEPAGEDAPPLLAGLHSLVKRSYLRNLALLMLLATASAALLDYVFRRHATALYSGDRLMVVFSWFHSVVALLTFLVQVSLARLTLDRMRVGGMVATLPVAVAASCLGVLAIPGLVSAAIARGIEMVMSNSIFRFGYELLYTPVAPQEKRPTKALIDVAAGRAGDALGGGLTVLVLAMATGAPNVVLLIGAAVLSALALGVALRLNRGYVRALEWSLRNNVALDSPAPADSSQALDITMLPVSIAQLAEPHGRTPERDPAGAARIGRSQAGTGRGAGQPTMVAGASGLARAADLRERGQDLRSGRPDRVRRALAGPGPLPAELAPYAIPLLADDELAPEVTRALRKAAPQVVEALVAALLDPEQPVEVRRRIPRILIAHPGERAVEGLLAGLEDVRFKVRLRCGWALARLHEISPDVPVDRERVLAAVLREVEIEKLVWGGRREMERLEDPSDSPFVDEVVRERANASLQHIFTLLSTTLPEQTMLRLAFNGLHAGDTQQRGTALEYLDVVLPPVVKEALWPFLEERGRPPRPTRTREQIIADLISINESMGISIAELRRLHPGG